MTNFKALALAALTTISVGAAPAANAAIDRMDFGVSIDAYEMADENYGTLAFGTPATREYDQLKDEAKLAKLVGLNTSSNSCPAGQTYVTQKVGGLLGIGMKTVEYGCMPVAQYQQMLANFHNRPQPNVTINQGGGPKVCYGNIGMYGQVFGSCY